MALGLAAWLVTLTLSRPSFQGQSIDAWFEEAVQLYEQTPNNTDSPSIQAFRQMEGDAVPFLVRWLEAQYTGRDFAYAKLLIRLPASVGKHLPQPRDQDFYARRHATALELLQWIGAEQRWKAEVGQPSAKPSITLAIPGIQAALCAGSQKAPITLWFIGPPAAPAVPDLIRVAQGPDRLAATMAVQAFGSIGSAASNAVPVLMEILKDERRHDRRTAVAALGGIGLPARPAVPLLVSMLNDSNEELSIQAARAVADIGVTPDDAVAAFEAMRQSSNGWIAAVGALGLWNRNPLDSELREALISFLHTDRPGPLLFSLARLGTNAVSFAPEIAPLVNHSDTNISRFAKRALRKLQGDEP